MTTTTQIEWADKTWSPVVGCTQITPGCAHCYALVAHNRRHKAYREGKLQNMPQYAHPFDVVQELDDRLDAPLGWRKAQRVFVNSQSDLFHEDIGERFIASVFAVMALADRHTFQVLTKRPARMQQLLNDEEFLAVVLDEAEQFWARSRFARSDLRGLDSLEDWNAWMIEENWPLENVWLGVSVENQRWADERIPLLLQTPAAVRFLSCEPLLGTVNILAAIRKFHETHWFHGVFWEKGGIDWVIAGAESGSGARPMQQEWVRSLRDECATDGVKFFYKQDATPNGRKISLPVLDGRQWTDMPEVAHA